MTTLMRKGDLWSKPTAALGAVIFWLLIIVTLMIGLSALRMHAIDNLVEQFFAYLPRAFSAAVILIVGSLLAGFISRAILIAAVNSGYHYSKLLAEAVRTLLTVLILAMAMEQLQIAPGIVLAAFSIIFGGIVTALAIAFGVGGIDAAKRMIERENGAEKKDEIEHI
jgi:Conserved TM helix